jgi:hypothetical protein
VISAHAARAQSSILLPFRRRGLDNKRGTLRPVETESGLVLEIGNVVHMSKENLSRNKVPLYWIIFLQILINS